MSDAPITVGYIKRAHGIRGGLLVVPLTDDAERFQVGATFAVANGPAGIPTLTVTSVTAHRDGVLVRTEEAWDRNRAESLAKATLTIPRSERRQLQRDEFWPEDLIGLEAVDPSGAVLGRIDDVVLGEAQDRLVVTTGEGMTIEVPFVAAIVGEPAGGQLVIDAPDGLFPDASAG